MLKNLSMCAGIHWVMENRELKWNETIFNIATGVILNDSGSFLSTHFDDYNPFAHHLSAGIPLVFDNPIFLCRFLMKHNFCKRFKEF